MLRMYVAQQCFGLSDEGVEVALFDNQAIPRFIGIDLRCEAAQDATTRFNFRHLLETHQLTQSVFNKINAHFAEKGLFLLIDTIVDATLIAAAPSTNNKDGKQEKNLELPVSWRVAIRAGKYKALPNTTECELLEKSDQTKANIRAQVVHPFHAVKNLFCHREARYRELAGQFFDQCHKVHPGFSGGVSYSALP
ncbi:MAG: transposase [Candidatus Nitrotoga sp.]